MINTHVFQRTRNLLKVFEECGLEPTTGVEVGVKLGKNALGLLQELPKLKLLLVDPYTDIQSNKDGELVVKDMKGVKTKAFKWLERYQDRIEWSLRPSIQASVIPASFVTAFDTPVFDFVFIDGAHDYENVKADIEAWLPRVRIGGVLAGHDFAPGYGGVKQAVRELFGNKFKKNLDVWFIQITEEMKCQTNIFDDGKS